MYAIPGKADRVLVTGGTGFTGRYLVRKLCAMGCDVHVIARSSSTRGDLGMLPITWHTGDVFDPAVVNAAMQGVNYVFHLAAAFRENKIADEVYRQVHVESTRLLAGKAMEQAGFRRFVHVSTVGLHGHIVDPPANEESPFSPGDIYQQTKLEGEQWVRQFAEDHGLPLTVIRPAMIYGPEDRRFLKAFKLAKLPVVPILGFSRGWIHLIHVNDLVEFMLYVINRDDTVRHVYICGNTKAMLFRDAIKAINIKLGKKSIFIRFPAAPFFALGYLCEKIFPPFNMEPPIFRRRVAFFTKDRIFNTEKMQRTGFKLKLDGIEGLHATLHWYQHNKWL